MGRRAYIADKFRCWKGSIKNDDCGDFDFLIGYAETREEAWELLKDDTNIDGSGGWDYDYVKEFLKNWEK